MAWLVEELDASVVVEVSQMHGGSTAAMHRVMLIDRQGHGREVVMGRYVRPEILSETPDVAEVEARARQLGTVALRAGAVRANEAVNPGSSRSACGSS